MSEWFRSTDWEGLLEHVTNEKIIAFFTQPLGLGVLAALMLLSILKKWRVMFVVIAATGAVSFLARSTLASGGDGPNRTILAFAGGAVGIGAFVIYYLFIRED